jgi:hypothetical protein
MKCALAAIALVSLAAVGCGGSGDDAARVVKSAAERTTNGGPIAVHEAATIGPDAPQSVNMFIEGTSDGKRRAARFSIKVDVEGGPPTDESVRELDMLDGEMAEQGEVIYMDVDALSRQLDLHGRWLKMDPADPISRKSGFAGTTSMGGLDPARPVDHLRAADDVRRVGSSDDTTHYRMMIDYDRYLDLIGPQASAALAPELKKLKKATHTARHPLDAWIGKDGRVHRIESKLRAGLGPVLISYRIDLEPAAKPPAIPRNAVTFEELSKE